MGHEWKYVVTCVAHHPLPLGSFPWARMQTWECTGEQALLIGMRAGKATRWREPQVCGPSPGAEPPCLIFSNLLPAQILHERETQFFNKNGFLLKQFQINILTTC